MSEFVMLETPLPVHSTRILSLAEKYSTCLSLSDRVFAKEWLLSLDQRSCNVAWRALWALAPRRRLELLAVFNAIVSRWYSLTDTDIEKVFEHCDWPLGAETAEFDVKGFWRVDKDELPEQRVTVLTQIAHRNLGEHLHDCAGELLSGFESFCSQNSGDGWLLPETLRLADYGLGHDDRAAEYQPVAAQIGPRFVDWQLCQTVEESWRECHLHARNQLGHRDYRQLLRDIECGDGGVCASSPDRVAEADMTHKSHDQGKLF